MSLDRLREVFGDECPDGFGETVYRHYPEGISIFEKKSIERYVMYARKLLRTSKKNEHGHTLIRRTDIPPLVELAAIQLRRNCAYFESWEQRKSDMERYKSVYEKRLNSDDCPNWNEFDESKQKALHRKTHIKWWAVILYISSLEGLKQILFPFRLLNCMEEGEIHNWLNTYQGQCPLKSDFRNVRVSENPSFWLFARFKIMDRRINTFLRFQSAPAKFEVRQLFWQPDESIIQLFMEAMAKKEDADEKSIKDYNWVRYPVPPINEKDARAQTLSLFFDNFSLNAMPW